MTFLDTLTLHIAEHYADKEFCFDNLADFGPLHGRTRATVSATLGDMFQNKLLIHTKRYKQSANKRLSRIYKIHPQNITRRVEEIKAGPSYCNKHQRAIDLARQREEAELRARETHQTISQRITRALDAITRQRLETA